MLTYLLAFTAVATLLTISPGPDFAVLVRSSIAGSRVHGLATAVGVAVGCLLWALASALGVTALLAVSTILYDCLRLLGAVYLCVLGVQAWRNRGLVHVTDDAAKPRSVWAAFRAGLLSNVLNPKAGVLYLSLLPTFVPPGMPVLPMTLLLAAIHVVIGLVWMSTVVMVVDRARGWFSAERIRRRLDRITGGALVGFGLAAASEVALKA
nr:LysE family translocator [Pseudonocardia spinosispora]